MAETTYSDIRPSALAGRWYPAHPGELADMVDGFLAEASKTPDPPGHIVGLLAPHAGLVYSGPVAGYAFALVRDLTPDVVAILCPSHHRYPAPLLTTGHDAYETPLGRVPVDQEALAELEKRLPLVAVRDDPEHAIEIELPFLQRVLPQDTRLLPLMLIDQSPAAVRQLADALADVLGERNPLLIASSDLSHNYPQETANEFDHFMLDRVAAYDVAGVLEAEEQQKGFACGRGAIAAVMWTSQALGADKAEVAHYATSGDTSGDYGRVVGYGAGVFYQTAEG